MRTNDSGRLAEPRDEIRSRQRRELAERLQSPTFNRSERGERRGFLIKISLRALRVLRSVVVAANLFEDPDSDRRERLGLSAARDDGEPRPRDGEDDCRHARARHRHMRAEAARGRLAAQLVADRLRRSEQALEAADVDRDEIGALAFVPRRKLLRDGTHNRNRRGRRARREIVFFAPSACSAVRSVVMVGRRRSVDARVQGIRDWGFGIGRDR